MVSHDMTNFCFRNEIDKIETQETTNKICKYEQVKQTYAKN